MNDKHTEKDTCDSTERVEELAAKWAHIAQKSQDLVARFVARQAQGERPLTADMSGVIKAFGHLWEEFLRNPSSLLEAQMRWWEGYSELWMRNSAALLGIETPGKAVAPDPADHRFRDEAWCNNLLFDFIKQSYLFTAQWLEETVGEAQGLTPDEKRKVEFYTRQFADALSPTNFIATNPEVLRATLESGGENLIDGLTHLLEDLERGGGELRMRMTDESAFELGRNVATTPGKVVYQNDLMQLIQYDPVTGEVARRPLLVMPPWINKYYILDLRAKNSMVKWWVEQGFTVFMISWVNPDESLADKRFDDYLQEGLLAALDAIEKATGEREVNAVGYCLGGTLLACGLAYLAAHNDKRVVSATFFTTMLEFSEPGDLGVFIDEDQLASLEQQMSGQGYLEGSSMAQTFNMLRANDLIWSFFVNNYLLGKEPFPFDLLYWNSDSTRMPAAMHSFYLRKMYLENKLREPGGIQLLDTPIDLAKIKAPAYFLSAIDDHIAPWKSTYAGAQLLGGSVKFVLSGSGHIAGVVNPPAANKYHYWTNSRRPKSPDRWLETATRHDGSWWPDWLTWARRRSGGKVPARQPGDGALAILEEAPGSYVRVRAV